MGTALEKYDFVTGPIDRKKLNEPWQAEYSEYQIREPHIHKYPPYLAHAPANNLGIKRSLHRSIGGFDESLTFAWEDVDYAFRLQLAGTKLHFAHDALVHYRLRHDFGSIYRQARAYGKGNVAFYKKYEPMAHVNEPWKARINAWISLLRPRTLLSLWNKSRRAWWTSRLGWQIGHIQGCITYCILAPLFWM
jgi:GT2 family glycosyltransferase